MIIGVYSFSPILGRPWLQVTRAIQDWGCNTINLYDRRGDKNNYEMVSTETLHANLDDEDDQEEDTNEEIQKIEEEDDR